MLNMLLVFLWLHPSPAIADKGFTVGSKKFTESVILGETARLVLEHDGLTAVHKAELGGTRILFNALVSGDIDVYPEYTGTIAEELLQKSGLTLQELRTELVKKGIGATDALGFNNTYAIGMKRARARDLGIHTISDLAKYHTLRLGLSSEFLRRNDGWPGLKKRYGLPQGFLRGLDHDIAYRALESGDIDVIDLYSTDAEISYYDIVPLKDDLGYFPRYDALYLYRLETAAREPRFLQALQKLSGKFTENGMSALNRKAKIDRQASALVAADFLKGAFGWESAQNLAGRRERILLRAGEHLKLVLLSLFLAVAVAIPLGTLSAKSPGLGQAILGIVGVIQTIPALALLVVLIRPLNLIGISGIGDPPALIALFLYSLLPILRSTHTGFQQISPSLLETASVLGLSPPTRIFRVEFPLALPSIISGIKTSAVLNVGFATLGALVGAGGFGQPILTGIRLDDYALILEGALPAAILAVAVQWFFDFLEKRLVSPGLKV